MQKIMCLFVVLFLQTSLVAADDKDQIEQFVGNWKVDVLTANGREMPEEFRNKLRLEFTKTKMVMKMDGKDEDREMKFTLNAKASPKTITTTPLDGPFKGKPVTGIFKFEKEALILCLPNKPTDATPKEFKSEKGASMALIKLSLVK